MSVTSLFCVLDVTTGKVPAGRVPCQQQVKHSPSDWGEGGLTFGLLLRVEGAQPYDHLHAVVGGHDTTVRRRHSLAAGLSKSVDR